MGFLDKVKGAFIEDDAPVKAAVIDSPKPAAPINQDNKQRMYEAIKKQVYGKQSALTAVVAQADALKAFIPDEHTRLKAAISTAGAGSSANEVAAAVDEHISDVNQAVEQFSTTVQQKLIMEVGAAERQVKDAAGAINDASLRIEELKQQIESFESLITTASKDKQYAEELIVARSSELNLSLTEFAAAAEQVRIDLQKQKQTILSTIG